MEHTKEVANAGSIARLFFLWVGGRLQDPVGDLVPGRAVQLEVTRKRKWRAMSDFTAGNESSTDSTFDLQSLPNFRSYPIALGIVGALTAIIGLILPFASLSFSIFNENLNPFEAPSNSPWVLSIPIGWIVILAVLVGVGCALAQLSENHTHKSGTVLGLITTVCGVVGGMIVLLELFWVSDKADRVGAEVNELLDASINVSPGLGYFVLLLTMIFITLSGVASLVHFDGKRHGR